MYAIIINSKNVYVIIKKFRNICYYQEYRDILDILTYLRGTYNIFPKIYNNY